MWRTSLNGPSDAIHKLRAMPAFLQRMEDPGDVVAFPLWKNPLAHRLSQSHLEPAYDEAGA